MAAPVEYWDLGPDAADLPMIEKARIWLVASANYGLATGLLDSELCYYCGNDATTFDHVLPRSKGGPDAEDNLVPVCRICNGDKRAATPEEWAEICRLRLQALDQIQTGHLEEAAQELKQQRMDSRIARERELDAELEAFLDEQGIAADASAEHAWRETKYAAMELGYRAGQIKAAQGRRRNREAG